MTMSHIITMLSENITHCNEH